MSKEKIQAQQMVLDEAYDIVKPEPVKEVKPVKVAKKELKTTTEVPKTPDIGDKFYVFVRVYCPDWLFIIIVIVGIYGVFKKWINKGIFQVLGFSLEDVKYAVERRKERDQELKEQKNATKK